MGAEKKCPFLETDSLADTFFFQKNRIKNVGRNVFLKKILKEKTSALKYEFFEKQQRLEKSSAQEQVQK